MYSLSDVGPQLSCENQKDIHKQREGGREGGRGEGPASHLGCSVFGITIRRRAFAPRGKIFLFFKLNKCNVSRIVEKLFSTQFLQWLATDTPQILNPKPNVRSPGASHFAVTSELGRDTDCYTHISFSCSFSLSLYICAIVKPCMCIHGAGGSKGRRQTPPRPQAGVRTATWRNLWPLSFQLE